METVIKTIVTPTIRHALTAIAGALVSYGLLAANQSGNFVEVATGLVIGAVGLAWSIYKNKKQVKDLKESKAPTSK